MPRAIDSWVNTSLGDAVPRSVAEAQERPPREGVLALFRCENPQRLFFQTEAS